MIKKMKMKGFKSGDLLSENGRQIILLSLDGNSHVEDSLWKIPTLGITDWEDILWPRS